METEGILSTIAMILAIIALVGVSYMYATNTNVDLSGVDDNQASILANSNLLTSLGLDISSLEDDLDDIEVVDIEYLEDDMEELQDDVNDLEDEIEDLDGEDGEGLDEVIACAEGHPTINIVDCIAALND